MTHLLATLLVSAIERLLLIGSVVLVLIVELWNSNISAVDRISFEHHGSSKRAKGYGSAKVMLALLMCVIIWITLTARLLVRNSRRTN